MWKGHERQATSNGNFAGTKAGCAVNEPTELKMYTKHQQRSQQYTIK